MRRGVRARFGQGVSATKHHTNQGANMPLRDSLSNTWSHIQGFLFPMLRDEVGPLTTSRNRSSSFSMWRASSGLVCRGVRLRTGMLLRAPSSPRPCSGCRRRTCSSSGSSPTGRCVGSVVGNILDRCRAKRRSRAPSPSLPKAACPLACTSRSLRRRTQSVSSVTSRGMPPRSRHARSR